MTIAKADYIEGLAKGLAVLEAFDTERQRLNATLAAQRTGICLLYTSPSPRDRSVSRMPSSA